MDQEHSKDEAFRPTPPPPPIVQVPAGATAVSQDASGQPDEAPASDAASPSEPAVPERSTRRRVVIVAAAVCAVALAAGIVAAVVLTNMHAAAQVDEGRTLDSKTETSKTQQAGTSDSEEAIEARKAFAAQLDALAANENGELTAYVQQFIDEYDAGVDAGGSYGFADLGITADELAEKLKDGLVFEIENVDVYDGKAWVDLEVTSKSFSDQADVFASAVDEADAFDDAEAYKAYLKEQLLGAFDKVQPQTEADLVVIEASEEGWVLSENDVSSLLGTAWYG